MHRDHWTDPLSKTLCPPWSCPICATGKVVLRPDSLQFEENSYSKKKHGEDYWGPEYIELIFTAWADCNNNECKQAFALSGTGGIEQFFNESEEGDVWEERFSPTQVRPAPNIIDLPEACPKAVRELFEAAFYVFWTDAESCAGKIRSAVEALLTHLGIPTEEVKDPLKPKRSPLYLHKRIELLQQSNPDQSHLLMAIKWMGNSGSHGGTVSRRDVLDAFEILEHSLPELLEKKTDRLKGLADRLVKKHKQ